MPSRRGGYRRERSSRSHRQHEAIEDENRTLRPILDHDTQTQETSLSASTPEPFSSLQPEDQKRPLNLMDLRCAPQNRGGKSRSAQKSEKQEGDSTGGSGSKLKPDSNCGDVNGKEDASAGGSGTGLNLGSDSGEIEGYGADSEKGNQNAEGMNSYNEVDDDEAVKRLEELRLSAGEPELSEELLSINKQLQEDEVLVNDASVLFKS